MQEEAETKGALHDRQYAYRKGRSTISAIQKVLETPEQIRIKAYKNREFCVMITIDIKNAFNSAPWQGIVDQLKKQNISQYLIEITKDYFTNRQLIWKEYTKQMTCGVPQGSVLGPTLWNIFYNQILELKQELGVEVVVYADDIAIIVSHKDPTALKCKAEYAVDKIVQKLNDMGREVASHKTETLILAGRRKLREFQINVEGTQIQNQAAIKYLGVYIDKDCKMTTHVRQICRKVHEVTNHLQWIMPSISGPTSGKRKMLTSVAMSILLYGAPTCMVNSA